MASIVDIPRPSEASKINFEAKLHPGAQDVRSQIVTAFRAALAAGKASERESMGVQTLSVHVEAELDTNKIRQVLVRSTPKAQFATDMDIQQAIRSGIDAFLVAMKTERYEVQITHAPLCGVGDGGYGTFKAIVSWDT